MAYFYNVFSPCLSNVSEQEALDYLNGFDGWYECEVSDQNIGHARYVATSDDGCIEMYYDYAADYYFFVDISSEEDDGQPDWHQEWADFGEEY